MAQESWNRDQDETGCHPPEGPVQCANNCGFFGSRTTMNLCSKCYRDTVLVVSQTSKSSSSSSRAIRMVDITGPTRITGGDAEAVPVFITPSAAAALAAQPSLAAASSASPSRCFSCRKRVGLTGFKCRCGDVFCSTHRYSDKHDCSFDYKAAGRDSIAKSNPVVVASKIEKI